MSETVKCVFVWHSPMDARTCRKCALLNGRVYHDQDVFGHVLVDSEFGEIWDLDADRSLMHGGVGTCRCRLEVVEIDVDLERLEIGQYS